MLSLSGHTISAPACSTQAQCCHTILKHVSRCWLTATKCTGLPLTASLASCAAPFTAFLASCMISECRFNSEQAASGGQEDTHFPEDVIALAGTCHLSMRVHTPGQAIHKFKKGGRQEGFERASES